MVPAVARSAKSGTTFSTFVLKRVRTPITTAVNRCRIIESRIS
jgi:hypothetical protein